MSVIIRLQNLPWSANALDIRQFFKGLSIPEGGVHIVGGEMGDAFIAFSTDEDARQAMMRDREKINEVQVRLLLSSRAEMQKVIETARQQSLLALQNAGAIPKPKTVPTARTVTAPQPPIITSNSLQNILSNQLGAAPSFLAYQQQAGITLTDKPVSSFSTESNKALVSGSGTTPRRSYESSRDRRRSSSRERRRSRSRDRSDRGSSSRRTRRDRSRSRSRDRERDRRSSRRSKSRERSRDRSSRDRGGSDSYRDGNSRKNKDNNNSNRSASRDNFNKSNTSNDINKSKAPSISPWGVPATNAYQTNVASNNNITQQDLNPFSTTLVKPTMPFNTIGNIPNMRSLAPTNTTSPNAYSTVATEEVPETNSSILPNSNSAISPFQSYSTNSSTTTTNNYNINLFGGSNSNSSDSVKPFAFQNPYTAALQATNSQDSNSSQNNNAMFPGLGLEKKAQETQQQPPVTTTTNFQQTMNQEPIAFANTNPYAQMYPNLFAQVANGILPKVSPLQQQQQQSQQPKGVSFQSENKVRDQKESCSIKMTNLCNSTTYSDIRKFFSGLYIPHNGIKMINDRHGLRIGTAYVQFTRLANIPKSLTRNNTLLKNKLIKLDVVPDEEFENVEDSFRPQHRNFERGKNWNDNNERRWDEDNNNSGSTGNEDPRTNNPSRPNNPFSGNARVHEPYSVLYIEDIPPLTTEQDIMKMFSSFTIYDILLLPNPENRREFVAHVRFSREDEAKTAFEEQLKHMIRYRKVRVHPGTVGDMDKAKEKLRLANEQLIKEERALAEAERKEEEKKENDVIEIDEDMCEKDQDEPEVHADNIQQDSQQQPNIPSIFDLSNVRPFSEKGPPSDPRLRRQQLPNRFDNNNTDSSMSNNNNINSMPPQMVQQNFQASAAPAGNHFNQMNPMEMKFVMLKNCEYNTRINDVAQLFLGSHLRIKHIELLRNERKMPAGEFIVELWNSNDAETAANKFNNIQFRSRTLRIRTISPQEIADRIGKPFMNYYPGGARHNNNNNSNNNMGNFPGMLNNLDNSGGNSASRGGPNNLSDYRNNTVGSGGMPPMRGGRNNFNDNITNNTQHGYINRGRGIDDGVTRENDLNDDEDNDDNNSDVAIIPSENDINDDNNSTSGGGGFEPNNDNDCDNTGIPKKFSRSGCVISMENVPYKADLGDIMNFFSGFDLKPDDIIRRFNDNGNPTGDARVAFDSPAIARSAFETKKRRQIFNRTIFLNIM